MTTDWLLVVNVAGRTLRFATQARTFDGQLFRPGLASDIELAEGVTEASVAVVSRELHALTDDLDAGTATLSFLEDLEATVYCAGQITDPASGAPDEPVSFTIAQDLPGITLGSQVPVPTARVDETTWPVDALHVIGSAGIEYPVIFGFPGDTGAATPVCVVPAPIAQWKSATVLTTFVVVAEDPDADAGITSVRIRNQSTLVEGTHTSVFVTTDLLGQRLVVANFFGQTNPADPSVVLLVGYSASTGGGVVRNLFDVIVYMLRRWAPESVDWSRLHEVKPALEPYNVDSWLTSRVSDAWVLIEKFLSELDVEIRVGARGRYFYARRFTSDPARVFGRLDVEVDAFRQGSYTKASAPENEITIRYRDSPESGWLSTLVACGSRLELQPAGVELGRSVIETAAARRSYAKYGRRPSPGLDLGWTWDQGTVAAVADRILERTALPATMVEYLVRPSVVHGIREGDELLVTDPDRPWVDQPAIVDAPPIRSLESVVLRLRVPQ